MASVRNLRNRAVVGEAEVVALGEQARLARVRRVPFGFPSATTAQADDDRDGAPLNLRDLAARQPDTTFFIALASDALLDSGIFAGDVLVVDRSLRPQYGALAVVTLDSLDGAMLVRHYCPDSAAIHLLPAHPHVAPINVYDRSRCHVWGVVTGVVRYRQGR